MNIRTRPRAGRILAPLLVMIITSGCGDQAYRVAKVKGRLLYNGEPVSAGTLTFTPDGPHEGRAEGLGGKLASAFVEQDGTFVLSTYEPRDGALVGNHRVTFVPPFALSAAELQQLSPQERAKEKARMASIPRAFSIFPQTVEVVRGTNEFEFELRRPQNE